jgi:F-type H+-transporting ATPase subunit b
MLELNSSFLWIFFLLWFLYFALNRFFFNPVGRIIDEREARAVSDAGRQESLLGKIESQTRSLEDQLGRARQDARRIREEWQRNGEETRARVVAEARERSARIMAEKLAQLDEEIGAAERELQAQVAVFSEKIRKAYL